MILWSHEASETTRHQTPWGRAQRSQHGEMKENMRADMLTSTAKRTLCWRKMHSFFSFLGPNCPAPVAPHPIAPGLPGLQTALYSCLVPCIETATYLFYFQCFECFCTELFACYWNLKFIINKDTWSNIFTPIPWLWIYSPSAPESWHSIYYVL